MAEWLNGRNAGMADGMADGMAEWQNGGMADGMMVEWWNGRMVPKWRNGRMAGMAGMARMSNYLRTQNSMFMSGCALME